MVPCLFRLLTGIPCPGCGLTRAWLSVFKLDFAQAFRYHPLFWVVPIIGILLLFKKNIKYEKQLIISLTILFFIVYIIRLIRGEIL